MFISTKGFISNYFNALKLRRFLLLVIITVFTSSKTLVSQSVNSIQASFGGGGIALIHGSSSIYLNPANMMINTYGFGNQIEIGTLFSETGIQNSLPSSYSLFRSAFLYSVLYDNSIKPNLHANLLATQGTVALSASALQASFLIDDWSLGFGFRTRLNSNFEFSENLYENSTSQSNVRYYEAESSQWNEFTIGFARELDYFNLINSNFNRFFIGFSISLLQPISHDKTSLHENLILNDDEGNKLISNADSRYAGYISSIFSTPNPSNAVINPIQLGDLVQNKGFGTGLNLSISYEIPFESIYKQVIDRKPITKFWRFSLALTDLGFMKFADGLSTINAIQDTVTTNLNSFKPIFENNFSFSINDRISILQDPSVQTRLKRSKKSIDTNTMIYLPTQIKAGFVLNYNWIRLGSDLFYGLNQSMNNTDEICLTGFSELKLIPFLPVRIGVLLKDFKPNHVSTGLGLDLWNFSWDASLVYSTDSITINEPKAFAATGLRVRF